MLYFFATSCTKTSSKNKANTCVDGRTVADVCTQQYEYKTSSSAVAQRRRDASCLSVVSFNSTQRRAESFVSLFSCLWCNVKTCCQKHFVVVSRHQQTPPPTTSDNCHNLRDRGPARRRIDNTSPVAALTARSEARYRLRIAISAYSTCIRRPR